MSKVIVENRDNIAIVRLNNGPTNALSPEVVDELSLVLTELQTDAHGVVLTGGEKFFSIGLDLPQLLNFSREEMVRFWHQYEKVIYDLYTLSVPSACVLAGHAVAGGHILALTSDFRFATTAHKQTGLNEIMLGVPVPYLADLMLRQLVGDRTATNMVYSGKFLSLDDAQKVGLVDVIYSPEEVEDQAIRKISQLASFRKAAFTAIKENRTASIREKYSMNNQAKSEYFLQCWFSGPVQEILSEAAKKF